MNKLKDIIYRGWQPWLAAGIVFAGWTYYEQNNNKNNKKNKIEFTKDETLNWNEQVKRKVDDKPPLHTIDSQPKH